MTFLDLQTLHDYNTRFSLNQTFAIPKVRTNYGIFNIRYQGAKVWNSIAAEDVRSFSFKEKN